MLSQEKADAETKSAAPARASLPVDEPTPVVAMRKSAATSDAVAALTAAAVRTAAAALLSDSRPQDDVPTSIHRPVSSRASRKWAADTDGPRIVDRMGEFAWAMRGKILFFFAVALALYLIVSIIKSLGVILLWAAGIVALVALVYWVRRGFLAVRRRITSGRSGNALRRITSLVRR